MKKQKKLILLKIKKLIKKRKPKKIILKHNDSGIGLMYI